MNKITKNILRIQKLAIGFCALSTLFCVSEAVIAKHKQDRKSYVSGTIGALLCSLGLGLATSGYLLNPYRKKERD